MDFIIRFNRAISHLRHEEVTDNHVDVNEQPKLRSAMPMEMQIMDLYTKQYFHKFQVELYESSAYVINFISEDENQSFYEVTKVCKGKFKVRRLLHDKGTDVVNCNCRKFEFEGISCRHILAFFKIKQIMFLPKYYIMKRWMKFARVESIVVQDGMEIKDAPDKSILIRRTKLSQLVATVIDEIAVMEEWSEVLTRALETVLKQVRGIKAIKVEENNSYVQEKQFDIPQQRNFNDPLQVRAKGCGKRLKSWSTANIDDDISNELENVDSGCE
ncbi:protein FAR1-RELATED SEQUENCE 9-like [Cornus florida]|uniref:protein FAR1-RELATED SEQUENCE 9-like n=1 Tax=Cornus florida TaxID=4283 RepID=UPI00289E1F84|nr:protein FAR1-RELATED SEQUENCE 9-like [Cornus florida]